MNWKIALFVFFSLMVIVAFLGWCYLVMGDRADMVDMVIMVFAFGIMILGVFLNVGIKGGMK
jgi:hypothetical protein